VIRQKIDECNCDIICFQETKRETFDHSYIKNFCPRKFNNFAFYPSIGNSGGIITLWNGNLFNGIVVDSSKHHVTVELTCNLSGFKWYLTNIYGPSHNENRVDFITWLADLDSSLWEYWMITGDFNLIRDPLDRNRAGGDINNMLLFNSVIQVHDLEEIPLKGRAHTWSNMQDNPLLEKLDWTFTSPLWTTKFPNTMSYPLARLGSDHTPIHIQVDTTIPKANIFRFENFWLDFDGFQETVSNCWALDVHKDNSAQTLCAKLKNLRAGLKKWSRNLSNLSMIINNCCFILALIDGLEEQRELTIMETNFRKILQDHTSKLMEAKRIYWKNRAKIK
jgi:hypothetical protein